MERSEEITKSKGFLTKRRQLLKGLLLALLVILAFICVIVTIIIYNRKRSQITSLKDSTNSQSGDNLENSPPPGSNVFPEETLIGTDHLDALVVPDLNPGIHNLTLDLIKEQMVPETSMLLFSEHLLNPDKCPQTSTREQLYKFFPMNFHNPRRNVEFFGNTYWSIPFVEDHYRSPADIIRNHQFFTDNIESRTFINLLEIDISPLVDCGGVNTTEIALTREYKPFRNPLTWFYDPNLLASLWEEMHQPDKSTIVEEILFQARTILKYRIWLSEHNRDRAVLLRPIVPLPDDPSQLNWDLWQEFCNWKTQRHILHTYCRASFDGEEAMDSNGFQEQFLKFIQLPRASPWVIYLLWMSCMFQPKEQADFAKEHNFLPRESVVALQQCYHKIFTLKAHIEEVIDCVNNVPHSTRLSTGYLRRTILNRSPLWLETEGAYWETSGQNLQWLFIAFHLNATLLPSLETNNESPLTTLFPSMAVNKLIDEGFPMPEAEMRRKITFLKKVGKEHLGENRQFSQLRLLSLPNDPHFESTMSSFVHELSFQYIFQCTYPIGLLHMGWEFLLQGQEANEAYPQSLSTSLTVIVDKYREGTSSEYTEWERELIAKILQSEIFDKYVSQRLGSSAWENLNRSRWLDTDYLQTIDASMGFFFLADLVRYYIIRHRLLPKLLDIPETIWNNRGNLMRDARWKAALREAALDEYVERAVRIGTLGELLRFFTGSANESARQQLFQEYLKALILLLESLIEQKEYFSSSY